MRDMDTIRKHEDRIAKLIDEIDVAQRINKELRTKNGELQETLTAEQQTSPAEAKPEVTETEEAAQEQTETKENQ